eukprot:TRINITY_DN3286_c0_g1_i1.p1 TRINITY_DN3286_c0_g1~~TRINITY_DN3286_c0_g1_i1.p1  ORF type:complete len:437 (-),score=146.20 TRINITY_DN3286_c0_g1_i1:165-1475(-)
MIPLLKQSNRLFGKQVKNNSANKKFVRNSSVWSKVVKGPEDPILGVSVAFQKDPSPKKVNLGVGAYRDDNGKPFILSSVKQAEEKINATNPDHEYGPIGGTPAFNKVVQELVFGKSSEVVSSKRAVTVQALSGTGSLRVGADFIKRWINLPNSGDGRSIYVPDPTWGNHIPLFEDAGFTVKKYRYYDPKTCGLDFNAMVDDIHKAPKGSIFLFHACAHNPTGVDPNDSQWSQLSQVCKEKGHFSFFDLAYQGFASGNPEKDVNSVQTFIKDGHQVAIASSFAKNFGLYGERVGALTLLTDDSTQAENVESQLKILIRPMYSNPPVYGSRIVTTILNDPQLSQLWRTEVKGMADRIISMRSLLVKHLAQNGSKRNWKHITDQIGMFCYSGLTPQQVDRLASEFHIYLTRNGRISMAGVTSKNVEYLAASMAAVTKDA